MTRLTMLQTLESGLTFCSPMEISLIPAFELSDHRTVSDKFGAAGRIRHHAELVCYAANFANICTKHLVIYQPPGIGDLPWNRLDADLGRHSLCGDPFRKNRRVGQGSSQRR
jgi:hypothetical protein